MKLTFTPPQDGRVHRYCASCTRESVRSVRSQGKQFFDCSQCRQRHERALIIDPAITWWVDKNQEYCHEVAGVFLHHQGKFLFFERSKAPFGLTIPAGHVDHNERPSRAAYRELHEETGARVDQMHHIDTLTINGDQCYRGADIHRWHVYVAAAPVGLTVKLEERNAQPLWLGLDQTRRYTLPYAFQYLVKRYGAELQTIANV